MGEKQPVDPRIGSVIQGRYEIRQLIAEGAMGAVYEGVRVQIGRPVAVKFLHRACASNVELQLRFEREAVAMSKLSHPNCVSVIDFGVDDAPYIVMDLVLGSTVRELIDADELTIGRCLSIVTQMLDGLGHAHENQLVHRDIKPANVKVGADDRGGDYVRVLDFGLAKLTDPSATQLTENGIVAGTTTYMSPEHAFGSGIDARSDLYSAGLVLFEMLTGSPPFESETAAGMLLMHRDRVAPRLSDVRPDVAYSEALEQVVAKALSKEKDDRYQRAEEFSLALKEVPEATASGAELSVRRGAHARSGTRRVLSSRDRGRQLWGVLRGSSVRVRVAAAAAVATGALLVALAPSEPTRSKVEHPSDLQSTPSESAPEIVANAPSPPPAVAADPTASAWAEQLLMRGEHEAAIVSLERLLAEEPHNPELHYLIGTAYFEVRRWDDGVSAYAAAIQYNPAYKSRPLLNRNVIRALRNQRTREASRELILQHLRTSALPHLHASHERMTDEPVRAIVQALIEELSPDASTAQQQVASSDPEYASQSAPE